MSTKKIQIIGTNKPLEISKGGTNAATAAEARANLGIDTIVDTLLPKSGGTMTGSVTMNGVALTENEDYGDTFPETASPGKIFFKNETENPALLKTGGVMTGSITTNGIILTKGVDYDDTLPTTVIPGKLFFKKVT